MTLASMAPPFAVRCANEVTAVLDGFPVDELRVIPLIPVQKLPSDRFQALPSIRCRVNVEDVSQSD